LSLRQNIRKTANLRGELVAKRLGNVGVGTNFYDGYQTPSGIDAAAAGDRTVSYPSSIVLLSGTYPNGFSLSNIAGNPVTVASTGSLLRRGRLAIQPRVVAGEPGH